MLVRRAHSVGRARGAPRPRGGGDGFCDSDRSRRDAPPAVAGGRRVTLGVVAQSGWGKGFHAQSWMESNAKDYDALAVLDYCAEYRGLVKAGVADHLIVGPVEAQWSVQDWMAVLRANPYVVLERHKAKIGTDRWRDSLPALPRRSVASTVTVGGRRRSPLRARNATALPWRIKEGRRPAGALARRPRGNATDG